MSRRNRRERAAGGELTWFERLMFSFMGPPQLGEDRAPEGYSPDPRALLCTKCGQPWDAHERVRTSSMTYMACPGSEG